MHHETSHAKAAHDYQQTLVQTIGDFLQHAPMADTWPDAATVFVHDECNPDSIGAIATACSPHVPADDRFDFQETHITGHRVDGSSVAGRVIEENQDNITLADSAMNPDHRVLNLPLPDQHAVLQAAFTKDRTPTNRQLSELLSVLASQRCEHWRGHHALLSQLPICYRLNHPRHQTSCLLCGMCRIQPRR